MSVSCYKMKEINDDVL